MRVLLTGAAGGLGVALVKQLVAARHTVIALDTPQALSMTYDSATSASVIPCSVNLADVRAMEQFVATMAESGSIDVVIHCAALSATGRFEAIPMTSHESVLNINLRAPMLLCAALLKHQLIPSGGTFVFIGSLSSYVSYPGASVYAASKDGLLSYGRSLSAELSKLGIHSLSVLPGPLRTQHAEQHAPPNSNAGSRLDPDIAAKKILTAIRRRQTILVPGMRANLFRIVSIIAPRFTERFMRAHIYLPLSTRSL